MNSDQIRQDQLNAGRTLSVREGFAKPRPRPQFNGPNKGSAPRKPPMSKGHDAILKRAQDEKRTISITLLSGDRIGGIVVDRDKYAIVVKTMNDVEMVVYKHSIEFFVVAASTVQ